MQYKVKSHVEIEENKIADMLANKKRDKTNIYINKYNLYTFRSNYSISNSITGKNINNDYRKEITKIQNMVLSTENKRQILENKVRNIVLNTLQDKTYLN